MATTGRVTAVQAWERSLHAVSGLLAELDRDMQDDTGITVIWYDVLLNLRHAPDMRLRMQALSDSLVLTRSGATRLIDRIEKAGLVRREPAAEDRRGYYAILTEKGLDVLTRTQKSYTAGIARHFGKHLNADERQTVFTIMSKFLPES